MRLDPANVPTEEWLTVGRFAVHLDCMRRPEAAATLVLVHGGGGNGRLLAPYAAFASAAGYETIAPDLPGYGLTQVPNKGHPLRRLARCACGCSRGAGASHHSSDRNFRFEHGRDARIRRDHAHTHPDRPRRYLLLRSA